MHQEILRAFRFADIVVGSAFETVRFSYSTFAKWTSLPVTFYVNPNNADVSSAAAIAAVQTALNVWNTAGSPFRYVYGGTASDTLHPYQFDPGVQCFTSCRWRQPRAARSKT